MNLFKRIIFASAILLAAISASAQEAQKTWTVTPNDPSWSRDKSALTVSSETLDGKSVGKVVHTGDADWAIQLPESIAVKPGEIYELSCRVTLEGGGHVSTGVTLYDEKTPTDWIFGGRDSGRMTKWTELKSEFVVPHETTSIIPRLTGYGASSVLFADYNIRKTGEIEIIESDETFALENESLSVTVRAKDGAFSIRDKRIGRTWEPLEGRQTRLVQRAEESGGVVRIEFLDTSTLTKWTGEYSLEKEAPELIARLEPADVQARIDGGVDWPTPLATKKGDRLIIPLNEGFSIPAEGPNPCSSRLYTYGGHGLCMAFMGVVDETDGPGGGYLMISETPDDGGFAIASNRAESEKETLFSPGPYWAGQKNLCGYKRAVRYCFFTDGGHVALAKRYREYAKKVGLYLPFTEKIRKNPKLEDGLKRLRGAANIWCWDKDRLGTIKMLEEAGIDRILWSASGNSEELTAMNAMPNVLTSRYDIYQDIMDPARFPEIGHGGWIPEAWPKDIILMENGDWLKGWAVTPKDKTKPRIPCGVICDSKALPYAEKMIAEELKTKPYKARFLDTTVAAPWQQCWSPDHPMTRSESRVWKMKLLALIGERFNLVCGSETGHDASVPYCDFYEGMMSLGPFRVPESGRAMERIWHEVPERVEKYQVGEAFRLPLWELVYHDCTVSYWYWGDYNNKLPKLWKKRDLFNALYGVPPMYMFSKEWFEKNRGRFAESWKIAGPVSERTGWSEMTDHRILSGDRTVQKSVFSDGTEVIVNFGDKPFALDNGQTLEGGGVWTNIEK